VALAVDAMLVIGISILLWKARRYIDISLLRLFAAPTIALFLALTLGYAALLAARLSESTLSSAALKGGIFMVVYLLVMFLMERDKTKEMVMQIQSNLFRH
jgi:hypothetical protein